MINRGRGRLARGACWLALGLAGMSPGHGAREVVGLDGEWRVVFDRTNGGVGASWWRPAVFDGLASRGMPVPSCWEEHEEGYEGVAWYAREVGVPGGWRGRHVRLVFDAVNYRAEVWLNGAMVGGAESGFAPVAFDVTPHLEYGATNRLIVRVVGPAVRGERVDNYVSNETPHWRGAYLGGIWQSVRLVATDTVFVRDVFVEPRVGEGAAVVNVALANESFQPVPAVGAVEPVRGSGGPGGIPRTITSRKVRLAIEVAAAGAPGAAVAAREVDVEVPPGGRDLREVLRLDSSKLWSPEAPNLYVARVKVLEGGGAIDDASVRFGMREFTARGEDLFLNGERVFIKGAFWEGLYPVGLGHPRDPGIVRKEIRMAKQAGFNLLRPWRMAPVPMILDIADEEGILLVGSPAIACMGYWPEETPRMEEHWTRAFAEMIRRDRNHPSIVMWETTNEIVRKSLLVRRHRVSLAGRALDPTRMILDESGGARSVWGSFAYLPWSAEPVPVDDRHIYRRAPVDEAVYRQLAGYGREGQAVFVSEVGYGSFPDIAANVERFRREGNPKTPPYKYHEELLESLREVMEKHRLGEIFPDVTSLCMASQEVQALGNKQQLEALRANPKADGYCIHAYTDGDWVVGAGVLDLWREPKKLYGTLKEVQRPLYLAVRVSPANVYASKGAKLTVVSANDGAPVEGELEVAVLGAGGGDPAWSEKVAVSVPGRVKALMGRDLPAGSPLGRCRAIARLRRGGEIVSENGFDFMVFPDEALKPGAGEVSVIDPRGTVRKFLESRDVVARPFDAAACAGPLVVAQGNAWNEREAEQLVRAVDWVRRGGVAVWLDPPGEYERTGQPVYQDPEKNFMMRFQHLKRKPAEEWPNPVTRSGIFPVALRHRNAEGGWIPANHYARKHPIFEGAEVAGFMDWPWQNVAPRKTLVNLDVPSIAGTVSWESYHDYRAETKVWHGVDVGVLAHGRGKMILSMLEIVPHLGADPLADRLMRNLMAFARSEQGGVEPAGDLSAEIAQKVGEFGRLRGDWDAKVKAAEAMPWP